MKSAEEHGNSEARDVNYDALQRPVWQSPILPVTDNLWIHPRARRLHLPYTNTFLRLKDGSLLTIEGDQACVSADDGATWRQYPLFSSPGPQPAFEYALVRGPDGAIVLVYADVATRRWGWDEAKRRAIPNPRRNVCCIKSFDEGRTWSAPVLVRDHGGTIILGIATAAGRIVVPIQVLLRDPDRWGQMTYASDDSGVTWQASTVVDVGGHGHHDGGFEATVVELRDRRLWMLLRTNLDEFWQAFSEDGGMTWDKPAPSGIEASSAPAWVQRLASGRLMMAWNRLYPEGATPEVRADMRHGGDCNACRPVASWHRLELSIAFSEDDGAHWSQAVVLARDKRLSYPTILERRPGEIWITTRFSQRLAVAIREEDFAGCER